MIRKYGFIVFLFLGLGSELRAQGFSYWAPPHLNEAAHNVEIVTREMELRVKASMRPRLSGDGVVIGRFENLARTARGFKTDLRGTAAKPYLAVEAFDRLEKAYFEALSVVGYVRPIGPIQEALERVDASMALLSVYYAFRHETEADQSGR